MTHFLQRTALIALATSALGACSTYGQDEALRPNFPIRTPDAAPPPVAPAAPPAAAPDEVVQAAPAAPVDSKPLEPLAPAPAPAQAAPAPAPAAPRAAAPPPAPTYRTVTTRSVTGKVVEVQGPAATYMVKKGDTLEKIARKLDTTVDQLKEDNGLKRNAIKPGQELQGPPTAAKAYVTGQGDTLFSIAKRFGVTAEALRDANGLGGNASIYAGQKIRLPEGYRDRGPLTTTARVQVNGAVAAEPDAAPEAEAPPAPAPARAAPRRAETVAADYRTVTTRSVTGKVVEVEGRAATYTVRKGDTLDKVADRLGTTVAELKEDNHLRKSIIHPGQELKGPRTTGKAYVAGQGDTLFSIGKRFGVTAEALRDENDLSRGASIQVGQKVRLPSGYHDHGPLTATSRAPVIATPAAVEPDEGPDAEAPAAPTPARTGPRRAENPPAEPAYRSVTTRSVTGKVVEVEGPALTYKVRKGDNLEKIARKLDTTVDQLKDDNHLHKSAIHPGQELKGPRTSAKAYVAGPGDTLALIGKRFGVSAEALRSENDLARHAAPKPGQKLRLPSGYRDHGPITTTSRVEFEPPTPAPAPEPPPPTPAPAPLRPTYTPPPAAPAPRPPVVTVPAPRPYAPPPVSRPYTPPPATGTPPAVAPTNAPTASDAQISELGRGRFVWPLQGAIVSDFGPKGGGQRNDGVNIGARAGDAVRAAAGGDVVYAGDQVPGFGNLVLIKHADGWVTAYGHLSRVDVKMQQRVAQGQQIGQAGATGGVSEPQLHFEVRFAPTPLERARPVDPKLVLPR